MPPKARRIKHKAKERRKKSNELSEIKEFFRLTRIRHHLESMVFWNTAYSFYKREDDDPGYLSFSWANLSNMKEEEERKEAERSVFVHEIGYTSLSLFTDAHRKASPELVSLVKSYDPLTQFVSVFQCIDPNYTEIFVTHKDAGKMIIASLPEGKITDHKSEKGTLFCSALGCKISEKDKELQICGRCRRVLYCSYECQKIHWKAHKSRCMIYEPDEIKKTASHPDVD